MADHEVLGGRYELGDPLGRGGMAEVRRAQDLTLGRPVAVKMLSAQLAGDPVFRSRFRREAQAAASLSHPTIVAVFDTGEQSDPDTGLSVPYIVMELVEGRTLRAVMTGGHQLPHKRALEVAQGVLEALSHSHDAGIIHRDIKPANVMLTPSGDVKVMDFGIARAVADTSSNLTQTAAVIGTAQYLSPEQARGEAVDQRSDVYSTGCLLYEMLVGRPPFMGESAISVVYQHVREAPVPPSQHNPLVHPQVEAITLKALAKDPADRYQSAREMKSDITRVLAGQQPAPALGAPPRAAQPVTTVLAGSPAGPSSWPLLVAPPAAAAPESRRRRPGAVILVASLVLLFLAVGSFGLYRNLDGREAAGGLVGVPNLLGSTRAEAESKLRNADLTAQFELVNGKDDRSVNTVVGQNPVSGDEVQRASVVTLEVNVGQETGVVPTGLLGRDVDEARKALESAGFSNVVTDQDDSRAADADKDEVTRVDPQEGSTVALDQEIVLTYASGDSRQVSVTEPERATRAPNTRPRKTAEPPGPTEPTEPTTTAPPVPEPTESSTPAPTATDTPSTSASASSSGSAPPSTSPSTSPSASASPSASVSATPSEPAESPTTEKTKKGKGNGDQPEPPDPSEESSVAAAAPRG